MQCIAAYSILQHNSLKTVVFTMGKYKKRSLGCSKSPQNQEMFENTKENARDWNLLGSKAKVRKALPRAGRFLATAQTVLRVGALDVVCHLIGEESEEGLTFVDDSSFFWDFISIFRDFCCCFSGSFFETTF